MTSEQRARHRGRQLWVLNRQTGVPFVAMMESADPRQRDHLTVTVRQHGPRRPRVPTATPTVRMSRSTRVTRGNNRRHQPPLRDTRAWRILSLLGGSPGSSPPPRTPTTSASASSSGASVPIVRRGAMRLHSSARRNVLRIGGRLDVGTLLLRREPNWQALGVLATLLAVGVALEKCQALRRQGDG